MVHGVFDSITGGCVGSGLGPMVLPWSKQARKGDLERFHRWVSRRDQAAVSELWRRHQRLAVHLVSRILRTQPDATSLARGVCDEAFVEALRTFRPGRAAPGVEEPFRAWFLLIARRRGLDAARRHRPTILLEPGVGPDPERRLMAGQELSQLQTWIRAHFLPSDWGAVVQRGAGGSWDEVARDNPVTVPARLSFPPGRDAWDPDQAGLLGEVARVLALAPRLRLRIVGTQGLRGEDAIAALGFRRARAVSKALQGDAPGCGRRLEVMAAETEDGCCVRFEVAGGAVRTAAAQRVRVAAIMDRYQQTRRKSP